MLLYFLQILGQAPQDPSLRRKTLENINRVHTKSYRSNVYFIHQTIFWNGQNIFFNLIHILVSFRYVMYMLHKQYKAYNACTSLKNINQILITRVGLHLKQKTFLKWKSYSSHFTSKFVVIGLYKYYMQIFCFFSCKQNKYSYPT